MRLMRVNEQQVSCINGDTKRVDVVDFVFINDLPIGKYKAVGDDHVPGFTSLVSLLASSSIRHGRR